MTGSLQRRAFLAVGGVALLALPGAAFAASATSGVAGQPQPFAGSASGQLVGNTGGASVSYQFNYPGDGSAVILQLTTNVSAPLDSGAAGINIYQNGNLIISGSRSGPFATTAVFTSSTAGPVVAQIYNYDPANPISYTLTAQGLAAQPASSTTTVSGSATTATSSVVATSSSTSAIATSGSEGAGPRPLTGPVSGRLVGNTGGAYALYQFSYPGDGSTVMLTLSTDNAAPLNSGAAGVNVYQNGARVTTASPSGPFQVMAVFSSSTAGPVVAQIYNYDPVNPINYTLTPQGLSTQPAASTATASAATTIR